LALVNQPLKIHQYLVSGRVQGVGYRYFTRRSAIHLGVTGAARNLPDGTVEVVVRGSEDQLQNFYEQLLNGPTFAHVEAVVVNTICKSEIDIEDFDVRF
jgi:acylphosphatase